MGKIKPYYLRFVGFATAGLGGALLLEHYIHYGATLHYWPIDHGVVGLALVIAGALLAGKKRE